MAARQPDSAADNTLADVLALVYERHGVDFRLYRRATVERRVVSRMRLAHEDSYADYLGRLRRDSEEMDLLVAHLTINVSRFFRDPAVFDLLRRVVLPELVARASSRPQYLWSAGCGNGEEAYSLGILLEELTPEDPGPESVIYGTDIDEQALSIARAGRYSDEAIADLPVQMADHFHPDPDAAEARHLVSERLRSRVQFVHHDLTAASRGPSALRFDLICCRNVLIYFRRDLQERVQRLLLASLAPGGYLCLGEAEWLVPSVQTAFEVVDRKNRIFRLDTAVGRRTEGVS